MGFGMASDEDEERQFVANKAYPENSHNVALDVCVLVFI